MAFILKWLSFAVMMFSILFNTIDASVIKKADAPKTEAELIEMQDRFSVSSLNDEITVINLGVLSISQGLFFYYSNEQRLLLSKLPEVQKQRESSEAYRQHPANHRPQRWLR